MIARTGFPEYIESIAIGPDIEFLKTNTSLCDIAEEFKIELNLAYKWKNVTTSPNVLPELRNYVKYLTVNGPEIDTESLFFYTNKVNRLPTRFKYMVLDELDSAFNKATKVTPNPNFNDFNNERIDEDRDFLSKLADLLKNCYSPCNYFRAYGDTIGTIFDISRNNNTNTEPSSLDNSKPPATHVGMNIFNKMHTVIKNTYAEMAARAGAVWDDIKSDKPSIVKADVDAYTSVANVYSDALSRIKRRTQDCFRMYDYNNRYNAYDATMNLGVARDKYFSIALKTGSLLEAKVHLINARGRDIKDNMPRTSAVEALGTNNIITKHDDVKEPKTGINVGSSTLIPAKTIHFTTYGKYDKLRGKGDTASDSGLGGSVTKEIDGKKYEYKVDLNATHYDEQGNKVIPVALSVEAKTQYGLKTGDTFTLQDSNGKTLNFFTADESPQPGINFDLYDGTSSTQIAAEAAMPFRKSSDKDASGIVKDSSDRNASDLTLTKTGTVKELHLKKWK